MWSVQTGSDNKTSAASDIKTSSLASDKVGDSLELGVDNLPGTSGIGVIWFSVASLVGVDVSTLSFLSITVSFWSALTTSDNKISAASDIKTSPLASEKVGDIGESGCEKTPET